MYLSRRFHRPIYFSFEFISNSDSHRNLSDQLQSEARTNVDMSTCSPHCFILIEACSCRLELAYFTGKISKNRLVCKNAVALAFYWWELQAPNGLLTLKVTYKKLVQFFLVKIQTETDRQTDRQNATQKGINPFLMQIVPWILDIKIGFYAEKTWKFECSELTEMIIRHFWGNSA